MKKIEVYHIYDAEINETIGYVHDRNTALAFCQLYPNETAAYSLISFEVADNANELLRETQLRFAKLRAQFILNKMIPGDAEELLQLIKDPEIFSGLKVEDKYRPL